MGRFCRELRSQIPIKGWRTTPLLHVTQYIVADCEDPPALLGVDPGQVQGRVLLTGLLVAKNETGLDFVL